MASAGTAVEPTTDANDHHPNDTDSIIKGIEGMMPDSGPLFDGDQESCDEEFDDDGDRGTRSSIGDESKCSSVSAEHEASGAAPHQSDDEISSTTGQELNEPTDRYGFFLSSLKSTIQLSAREIERRKRKEISREGKWRDMTSHWDKYAKRRVAMVKRRIRKGIPDVLRGGVWTTLGRVPETRATCPHAYSDLLRSANAAAERNDPDDQCHETIERDITRTFPRHRMFSNDGNGGSKSGLASLRNVLRAYSAFDKDVQYCQGMGFFTAMFLIYMSEEEAFWQLIGVMQGQGFNPQLVVSYRPDAIIDLDELHIPKVPAPAPPPLPRGQSVEVAPSTRNKKTRRFTGLGGSHATTQHRGIRGLFMPDMAETHMALHTMSRLTAHHLPKVAKHFGKENIQFSMFATNWYLTIFSSFFPFDLVTRVWDSFLAEGYKVSLKFLSMLA